jgi:hypothetical protein
VGRTRSEQCRQFVCWVDTNSPVRMDAILSMRRAASSKRTSRPLKFGGFQVSRPSNSLGRPIHNRGRLQRRPAAHRGPPEPPQNDQGRAAKGKLVAPSGASCLKPRLLLLPFTRSGAVRATFPPTLRPRAFLAGLNKKNWALNFSLKENGNKVLPEGSV